MNSIPTAIPDVLVLQPKIYQDERGFFMETFQTAVFQKLGIRSAFVQDNQSFSKAGVLRGLHYQLKNPQGKLVRVVTGAIFDVAVDLRKNSSTFGRWVGRELNEENKEMLWIPPGFAHGFYVLRDNTHCLYKCTDYYFAEDEACLVWNDRDLNIAWPLQGMPIVSAKDSQGVLLKTAPTYS